MKPKTEREMNKVFDSIDHPIIEPETGRIIPKKEMIKDITDFINGTYNNKMKGD